MLKLNNRKNNKLKIILKNQLIKLLIKKTGNKDGRK